ncbi:MAG TPA: chemotaxis protein CheB [Armatimonadota bacterium]|jgi:two-component system CheB/CheR fusion protein
MSKGQTPSGMEEHSELQSEAERPVAADVGQEAPGGVPVVGIGASAGGLEAIKQLLENLPGELGLAVIVVQHLDPKHPSLLTEILGRSVQMPVTEAVHGLGVEPNHVYVIPPDTELTIVNQRLELAARSAAPGLHLPIDQLFRSLADDYGSRSIGVILSGAGTDGCAGMQAIHEAGGVTFAQAPETAEYPSMPVAAASTGVDFVLAPDQIAAELARLAHDPLLRLPSQDPYASRVLGEDFRRVLEVMHEATGIDFSLYRERTVHRRVQRRIALRGLGGYEEYSRELARDPEERDALQRDLLIGVTSFFRDPGSFEVLRRLVWPQVMQDRPAEAPIRIWVPGCATGEEAYSIAISLQEYLKESGHTFSVRVFGSDISGPAIDKARAGRYPESIAADVGPELLERWFTRAESGYQVSKALRETCVFSQHDLIDDPPFSKLDLISCRNVLIYLPTIQKDITQLFHYALNEHGFLMLGRSEVATLDGSFVVVDGDHRVYQKKGKARRLRSLFLPTSARPGADHGEQAPGGAGPRPPSDAGLGREVDRVLLSRFSPTGVVVDDDLDVIEIRGEAAPYLRLPSGKLSFSLLTLVPETGLYLELEKLVREVMASGEPASRDGLEYDNGGSVKEVDVEVLPLGGRQRRAYLVLFEPGRHDTERPVSESPRPERDVAQDVKDRQIAKLRHDLSEARQRLLALHEEHQTSQEEIQTTAEETLSTNEELQSLNEELETAKEELQSTNEELITVNQELQAKNAALLQSSQFTMAIVETVQEPLLVLGADLRVKSANHAFHRDFLVPPGGAEGKLLYSLCGGGFNLETLRGVLGRVLPGSNSFSDLEIEQDFQGLGHRHLMLSGCRLDGLDMILLAISDVTDRKVAEAVARKSEEYLRQSQKMEAIGRLAGGIAHDFNNLLTTILGYSELVQLSLTDERLVAQVKEIQTAGQRAATLTQQLLAFGRRQILRPSNLNLNLIVADLDGMLQRLVGEQIQIVLDTTDALWRVSADPGEIGRAVMNLCLNARDAMPGGGTLTIHTANVVLEDVRFGEQKLAAGPYVLLSVGDTGVGIDDELKAHIFEPFFTTKEVGKGTGLGLATVLGIVEQSGGAIWCDSELGQGTTFRLFLPALPQAAGEADLPAGEPAQAPRGLSEVILLVEDEGMVRRLTRVILEGSGYVVLEARDGREGLSLVESHQGAIHLLLSDVIMPGMGGRELAEQAVLVRPDLKVLFMSGHTQDVVLKEGIAHGVPFLQKPFGTTNLARKVREVLDSPPGAGPEPGQETE